MIEKSSYENVNKYLESFEEYVGDINEIKIKSSLGALFYKCVKEEYTKKTKVTKKSVDKEAMTELEYNAKINNIYMELRKNPEHCIKRTSELLELAENIMKLNN